MGKIKLKRCPFCGFEAELKTDKNHISFIRCSTGCCKTYLYQDPKTAAKVWNTRTPIEKIIEKLKDLRTKKYVSGITYNPYEFGACHAIDDAIKVIKESDINEISDYS